jgi:hypothetical protein
LDRQGKEIKKEARDFQVTFYHHRQIERLTAIDGRALSAEENAKEDRRIEKLVKQLEEGKAPPDPKDTRRMKIGTLLAAERFSNPRRERFRGRNVIVFDFEPDPGFKPASTYESFYRKMAGTMWVDEADLQVARVEFTLIDAFKVGAGMFFEMKPGSWFVGEQDRFFSQIWLPPYAKLKFAGRAMVFYGFGIDQTTTFSDYHQFHVDAKDKIKSP